MPLLALRAASGSMLDHKDGEGGRNASRLTQHEKGSDCPDLRTLKQV